MAAVGLKTHDLHVATFIKASELQRSVELIYITCCAYLHYILCFPPTQGLPGVKGEKGERVSALITDFEDSFFIFRIKYYFGRWVVLFSGSVGGSPVRVYVGVSPCGPCE